MTHDQSQVFFQLTLCSLLIFRNMPALNVSVAYSEWSKMQRKDGLDGFGGTTPCMQTKGARKFYAEGSFSCMS